MTKLADSLAGAALRLAEAEWCVLPLQSDSKAPAVKHGVRDATRDPHSIRRWWDRGDFNIGIATGSVSGLTVVDIDSAAAAKELSRIAAANGGIPATIISCTPRGHHLYFEYFPGVGNRVRVGGLDIDVRSDGGYVVAPPSRLSVNERYTWHRSPWTTKAAEMPAWLRDTLLPRASHFDVSPTPHQSNAPRAHYGMGALRREADQLSRATVGGRNDALNRSAFRMGSLIEVCGLLEVEITRQLIAACKTNGLLDDDGLRAVQSTIMSGLVAGRSKPRRFPDGK